MEIDSQGFLNKNLANINIIHAIFVRRNSRVHRAISKTGRPKGNQIFAKNGIKLQKMAC